MDPSTSGTAEEKLQEYHSLTDVPPEQQIRDAVDAYGGLILRDNIVVPQGYEMDHRKIMPKQALALALTEACCETGSGKVFWFPVFTDEEDEVNFPPEVLTKIASYKKCLPNLVYLPFVWGKQDQQLWRQTPHIDRLDMLNARAGGLGYHDCVMPLNLYYGNGEKNFVHIDCHHDPQRGSPATLLVLPRPYLAWIEDLRALCASETHFEDPERSDKAVGLAVPTAKLTPYAVQGWDGVVDRLAHMYYEEKARAIVRWDIIIRDVIAFHQLAS